LYTSGYEDLRIAASPNARKAHQRAMGEAALYIDKLIDFASTLERSPSLQDGNIGLVDIKTKGINPMITTWEVIKSRGNHMLSMLE
jgi:hypothetical protein